MIGLSRHGRIGSENLSVRAEINVTSLVDVAFTLLVIFMITAPILQGGVEIAVPRVPSAPLQVSEGLIVSVNREGQIFIDETAVTREEFAAAIGPAVEAKGDPSVYVKGDGQASYGDVLWVVGKLKATGIEAVSLVAEPEVDR